MLLGRIGDTLGGKLLEGTDNAETGVTRLYHIVYITILGCIVGVAEQFVVFRLLLCKHFLGASEALASFA